ncbi:hypothetical protein [Legionella sp. WA2022007384]
MQKKIDVLNTIKPVSSIELFTKYGKHYSFDITTEATKKFGIYFLDRITTPKGIGTVIGVYDNWLWIWIDHESGPTYWNNITGNILNVPGFSESGNIHYPPEVRQDINEALGFEIPFAHLNFLDFLTLLKTLRQYSTEFLTKQLKFELKNYPENFNMQLGLLIKEFERLSVSDLDILAGFSEITRESNRTEFISFIQDTKISDIASKQDNTIKDVIKELQTQIDIIKEKLELLGPNDKNSLYLMLTSMQKNLETSRDNLIKATESLNTVGSEIPHIKKISPFENFSVLLSALIETYYEFPFTPNDPLALTHYLEGASKMMQFIYDQGHLFFDDESKTSSDENNNQEEAESLNHLELMYLFLLLSGNAATPATIQAYVYLKIFKMLGIQPNDNEHMPETFNLGRFVLNKPEDFIKLYHYFFLKEGPCKQKAQELISNNHAIFLSELGQLTYYYAMALEVLAIRPNGKPGAKLEISYHFKQSVSYLLEASKQGMSQAVETLGALMSSNDTPKYIEWNVDIAILLATYYTNSRNFAKAHHYLELASKLPDKAPNSQKDLQLLQVKLSILEQAGEKQKEAIEALIQLMRANDKAASDLFQELSMQIPAVAFTAVAYWYYTDINKMTLAMLELAAKENSSLVAWYQNRYQVEKAGKQSELALVLKAVKVGFPQAILELHELLSNPEYAKTHEQSLLPIISDFDISQHIAPAHLTTLLVNYTQGSLSKDAFNKFIESLVHTSFKEPEQYFELLSLILRDLRALIDSEQLIAMLYAIKRTGLLSPKNHDLLKTIATLLIEQAASDGKSTFHYLTREFLPHYPLLAQALNIDTEAWSILNSNIEIGTLVQNIIKEGNSVNEESALLNLSLFNHKEELTKSSKEEVETNMTADIQNSINESEKTEESEERENSPTISS